MFNMEVNIQAMEELEEKYGIALHVDQFEDKNKKDEFYLITPDKKYKYVGSTIREVKKTLKKMYGH